MFFKKINKLNKYEKVSFSQCGEDLIVSHIFSSLDMKKPSFIDIGAHHPFYMSNTALFSLNGSTGINIEPDPVLYSQFNLDRPKDINLNIGIADKNGSADFYTISTPTLNTFSKETALAYEKEGDFKITSTQKININTVKEVISKYAKGVFPDFLNLDAEGIDEEILKSIDFNQNCPTVICLETISFSQKGMGLKNLKLISLVEEMGYLNYADTNVNTIFVLKNKWER
jgi:FkbM family methyltransferase